MQKRPNNVCTPPYQVVQQHHNKTHHREGTLEQTKSNAIERTKSGKSDMNDLHEDHAAVGRATLKVRNRAKKSMRI